VPEGLKGEFTVKLTYSAEPFKVTLKDAKFTVK
jgi:hypothetical protein